MKFIGLILAILMSVSLFSFDLDKLYVEEKIETSDSVFTTYADISNYDTLRVVTKVFDTDSMNMIVYVDYDVQGQFINKTTDTINYSSTITDSSYSIIPLSRDLIEGMYYIRLRTVIVGYDTEDKPTFNQIIVGD